MIFDSKSERTGAFNTVAIKNEISQECLNPEHLVGNLTLALSNKIKSTSGHIHVHFRNKSDHLIIAWSSGMLRKIAVKSRSCKKGRCVKWEKSQFCDYKREDVLEKLHGEIERMEVDEGDFNKTWPSYSDFIDWLIETK